jgi:integrase
VRSGSGGAPTIPPDGPADRVTTSRVRRHIRKRSGRRPFEARIEEGWKPGPDGLPRRSQRSRSFRTLREAERWVRDQLNDLQDGSYIEPSRDKLGTYLEEWLAAIRPSIRPSAWASFESHVRIYLTPQLGHLQLQQLAATDVDLMTARLLSGEDRGTRRPLSPTTVRRILVTLNSAVNYAVWKRKLDRNPVTAADRPRAARTEMKTWTADELGGFLDGAREHRLGHLFTVLATTGLRRGEALGLRWSDVDLDEGRLAVRQTLLAVNNHMQFGEPKTHRSRRTVDLDASTVAVLKAHRKAQLEERAEAGLGRPRADALIFTNRGGDPLHPNLVSRTFGKLVREVGLPTIRLHGLRHTHATLSLQAGVHVKIVSERLGHSSVVITLDTYSHAIPGLQRDAAEKVAALIPGLVSP